MFKKIRVILGGSEGRMGKIIQGLVSKSDDIEIVYDFDLKKTSVQSFSDIMKLDKNLEEVGDIYVDFTSPDSILPNVHEALSAGLDCVIGTTGWYDHLDDVRNMAIKYNRRILYAPNYSPGVNVLLFATREISRLLNKFEYDVAVLEIHHSGKVDAPSGTAITLGNILLKEMNKKNLAYERRGKRGDEEIDVLGTRLGRVAGHHEVWFSPKDSYSERLVLQHDVFTPEVFGIGVLMGIRWMVRAKQEHKPAGLYNFSEDVLNLNK